jgi:hypothetical protein
MPELSILIPHKPRPSNDKALKLAIDSIMRFTSHSYELIIDTKVPGDPYVLWNEMAEQARGGVLVFSNSDVIFAPGWEKMILYAMPNEIATGYIVEPGNIGVAPVNIKRNFGKTPDEFDEAGFHSFIGKHGAIDIKEERGWYMPCAMNREWFLSTGGFPTDKPFPEPNDIAFWEDCKTRLGTKFMRAKSYSYHFQAQSTRE